MDTTNLKQRSDAHVLNTYGDRNLAFVRGEAATLWDVDGKEYIDCFAGIAVCNLGHCHPAVTRALQEQAATLVHVSNLFHIAPQVALAELLCAHSFADKWFFCNGGAEANEAAIKLTRRYWAEQGTPKPEIVTAHASFHGRTMATLTATGQKKVQQGFAPLLPGFHYVAFGDLEALENAITPAVGAVMLEPIQGEGGVRCATKEYWRGVRKLCDKKNVLLILDEVQTGMGRTGKLFAHEHYGITPDIMCLAKGLGNGVPIGAMGCTDKAAAGFGPGAHGCTFGGNYLSSAAAIAVMKTLTAPGFLDNAAALGTHFQQGLEALAAGHDGIVEVRGKGLILGVECKEPVAPLLGKMIEGGIICGPAGPNVLRFLPPLVITKKQLDRALSVLGESLGALGW